ncbi:nucleotidyltransferase domain-containing protein [Geitlerinema sp. P-1104]|uniref:type VII toxin-antitoxin system MntA family adenylyltransferase antitoxin n=1 Tax=Geitlerinema sp. P-1104 TaxID=2546230 RepID=UPI0014770882|nr:nucleotidyltransferase domain-containing protein [Geitlerinema sp. P-1104]NMG61031.1 nucleotidyltransferase domain-containing protein [Geitlerinema sp. P-1104]
MSNFLGLQVDLEQLLQEIPYLKMLILFGSRARGDTHSNSDWDFAVLYDEELRRQTVEGFGWFRDIGIIGDCLNLNSDNIDVVEIERCSELMAHHIARDGKLIYEQESGLFEEFKKKNILSQETIDDIIRESRAQVYQFLQEQGL